MKNDDIPSSRERSLPSGHNGPELVWATVQSWLGVKHVDTHYIDPGSPWQNGYTERFNSIFRMTCLN